MSLEYSAEERSEWLARADEEALVSLAERILANRDEVRVVSGPETGLVMLQVREPVAAERFYLGEVLVSRATVDLDGTQGWAMRLGGDRVAALAAAVCDAAARSGDGLAAEVEGLCRATQEAEAWAAAARRAELAPTVVSFEDLE